MLLLFVAILSVVSSAVTIDPKILSPVNGTMWRVGNREIVSWDPNWRTPNGDYYNSRTRVSIALFDQRRRLINIAENYPYIIGNFPWTVPEQVVVDPIKNETVPIGNDQQAQYRIMVFPTYFDWKRACPGCFERQPLGAYFTIVNANCSGLCDELAPARPGMGVPDDQWNRDYTVAVRAVGIGVGVVALIVFSVALFVYTKKGSKAWKRYQRRRSGLVYKYRTPSTKDRRGSSIISNNGAGESPLRKFFSTEEALSGPPSPKRYESLDHLNKTGESSDYFTTGSEPPQTLPPAPPLVYTGVNRNSINALPEPPNLPPPLPAHLNHPATMLSSTHALRSQSSTPSINQSEALLVGNTFRNVLRVNESEDASTLSSYGSSSQVHSAGRTPVNSSFGCSPVLSQLGWVDEESHQQDDNNHSQ
jgi:hypothetical protein